MMPACHFTRTEQKLLELRHVSLSFGTHLVLRDVNATVTDITRPDAVAGQVIAFLGPSGMGKTQLARIITGLQAPTNGACILDGDVPTRAGLVGFVPQDYPLFEFLTVRGNLHVAGRQGGLSADDTAKKIGAFTQDFQLAEHLDKYPKALSGGTRQRVAIARQMMCCKHYLVMDEPFSGLDPILKAAASQAVTQLAAQDELNTIIVITHDISEGLAVADMVWLLGLDADGHGGYVPGARLVEQYDLAAAGIAWHPDIQGDVDFQKFVGDVKQRFRSLR